jgi:hypothetical protein
VLAYYVQNKNLQSKGVQMKNIITLSIVALFLGGVGTLLLSAQSGKNCERSSCSKKCIDCDQKKSCGSC